MDAKALKGVLGFTYSWDQYGDGLRDIEILDILRSHRPAVAKCILQISNHKDAVKVTSLPGGIVNITVSDPLISLIDVATFFSNAEGSVHEICIKPFSTLGPDSLLSWPKSMGQMLFIFAPGAMVSYLGRVCFNPGVNVFSKGSRTESWPPLWVVYDGREKFSPSKYWAQEYDGNVRAGSTVMVLFSMKRGKLPEDVHAAGVPNSAAVYLNLLGVVVLAEPSAGSVGSSRQNASEVHGVDQLVRLADISLETVPTVEDEVEVGETF